MGSTTSFTIAKSLEGMARTLKPTLSDSDFEFLSRLAIINKIVNPDLFAGVLTEEKVRLSSSVKPIVGGEDLTITLRYMQLLQEQNNIIDFNKAKELALSDFQGAMERAEKALGNIAIRVKREVIDKINIKANRAKQEAGHRKVTDKVTLAHVGERNRGMNIPKHISCRTELHYVAYRYLVDEYKGKGGPSNRSNKLNELRGVINNHPDELNKIKELAAGKPISVDDPRFNQEWKVQISSEFTYAPSEVGDIILGLFINQPDLIDYEPKAVRVKKSSKNEQEMNMKEGNE